MHLPSVAFMLCDAAHAVGTSDIMQLLRGWAEQEADVTAATTQQGA